MENKETSAGAAAVDAYIASFPEKTREKLPTALIRRIVRFRLGECSKGAKKG